MNFIDLIFMRKTYQKMTNLVNQQFIDQDVFEFFNQNNKATELDEISTQFGYFDYRDFDSTYVLDIYGKNGFLEENHFANEKLRAFNQ